MFSKEITFLAYLQVEILPNFELLYGCGSHLGKLYFFGIVLATTQRVPGLIYSLTYRRQNKNKKPNIPK